MTFKVTNFGTNQKPICDFLLVINTNLHPISHRFEVIADYWSNLHFRKRGTALWYMRSGWSPKLRTTKFSLKKLETLFYRTVFTYLQTIISFCHNTVARSEYRLEVTIFDGGGSLWPNISDRGGRTPATFCARSDTPVNALQLCRWKFSPKETL